MRVMPSVTDTIVPTLRASVTPLKLSIRCLIRSLISVALIAMSCPVTKFLSSQLVSNAVEPRAYGAIDDQIAGAQHGPAQQGRVGLTVQADLPLQPALQSSRQRIALTIPERSSGRDRHIHNTLSFVLQLVKQSRNLGEVGETPVLRERLDEVAALLVELGTGQVDDKLGQLRVGHSRMTEQVLHTRILHHSGSPLQRVRPGAEGLVALRLLKRRSGVRSCDCYL